MTLKLALRAAASLLLVGAAVSAWIWNGRRLLPYNGEGRFLDSADGVAVNEQAVIIYGMLALALALLGMIFWLASQRG